MNLIPEQKKSKLSALLVLKISCFLWLLLIISLTFSFKNIVLLNLQHKFNHEANVISDVIYNRYIDVVRALDAIHLFFQESDFVSPTELENFSSPFFTHEAITTVAWAPFVAQEDRRFYEEEIQRGVNHPFSILEQNKNGKYIKAGQRPYYYPLQMVIKRNHVANQVDDVAGIDFTSLAEAKKALELMNKQGDSNALVMVDKNNQKSMILLKELNRNYFKTGDKSIIYIRFLQDLILNDLSQYKNFDLLHSKIFITNEDGVSFELISERTPVVSEHKRTIWKKFLKPFYPTLNKHSQSLEIAGHVITIQIEPCLLYLQKYYSLFFWLILPFGFFVVLILFLSFRKTIIKEGLFQKALRESENKFRLFYSKMTEGAALCRLIYDENHIPKDYIIVDINKSYERIFEIRREEIVGRYASQLYQEKLIPYLDAFTNVSSTGKASSFSIYAEEIKKYLYISLFSYESEMFAITIMDITEQRNQEASLRKNYDKMMSILRTAPSGIIVVKDRRLLEVNDKFCEMLGYSREELINQNTKDGFLDQSTYEEVGRKLYVELANKEFSSFETKLMRKNHEIIDVIINATPLDLSNPAEGYVVTISDITDRKRAEQSLLQEKNLLKTLINNIPDAIYVKDIEGRKLLTNPADMAYMGLKDDTEVIGKTDWDMYPKDVADLFAADDRRVTKEGQIIINREETLVDPERGQRWFLTSKLPLKDSDGTIKGLIGIGRDITERKLLENKLISLAHYDALTTLPNRSFFIEKVSAQLLQAKRSKSTCAVLFIDLDHFKKINDTLGHTIGDALLKEVSINLNQCIRETDTLARFGGDEFVIFLYDIESPESARMIADRILQKFTNSCMIKGHDLFTSTSIGIAVTPNDGYELEELLKNADTAMYAAKESGRNNYCFFNAGMNHQAVKRMMIERDLRNALHKNEFLLYYQPIVSPITGKLRGFEALIRWNHEEKGIVQPMEFIQIAEETGLIIPIGEWVINRACKFNRSLLDQGFQPFVFSVNISVAQLRREGLVEVISQALSKTQVPPETLEIEITESMLVDSFESTIALLNHIRQLGVRISLDDFGSGYSSLNYLQKLPIDSLKIDRLFIKEISQEKEENDLTPAIIDLSHKLGLNVIAEGVETELQLGRLKRHNCDYFQGFLFSRPMAEDQILSFLREYQGSLEQQIGFIK